MPRLGIVWSRSRFLSDPMLGRVLREIAAAGLNTRRPENPALFFVGDTSNERRVLPRAWETPGWMPPPLSTDSPHQAAGPATNSRPRPVSQYEEDSANAEAGLVRLGRPSVESDHIHIEASTWIMEQPGVELHACSFDKATLLDIVPFNLYDRLLKLQIHMDRAYREVRMSLKMSMDERCNLCHIDFRSGTFLRGQRCGCVLHWDCYSRWCDDNAESGETCAWCGDGDL